MAVIKKNTGGIYVNLSHTPNKPVYSTLDHRRANKLLPPTPEYSSLTRSLSYENPYATIL